MKQEIIKQHINLHLGFNQLEDNEVQRLHSCINVNSTEVLPNINIKTSVATENKILQQIPLHSPPPEKLISHIVIKICWWPSLSTRYGIV